MRIVDFLNIREVVVTLETDDTLSVENEGMPVKLTDNKTVGLAVDGDVFIGKMTKYEGRKTAAVRIERFELYSYTGAAPAVGPAIVAANGKGGVKVAEEGKSVTVINVDKDKSEVLILQ